MRDQAEKAIGKAGHLAVRKRKDPNFVLGILGCMAQNRGSRLLDRLPDLDLVAGTQKFHRVPDHLDNLIASMNGQGRALSIIDLEEEAGSQNTINAHKHWRKAGVSLRFYHAGVQHEMHLLHCP